MTPSTHAVTAPLTARARATTAPLTLTAAAFTATSLLVACGAPQSATQSSSGATTEGAGGALSTSGAGASGGASSSSGVTTTPTGPINFCTDCTLKSGCSAFVSADLLEISGLAPSAQHDGAYYVHNDSGDSPRFFATNCAGDDLGVYNLTNAAAVDWEDMAAGPCDAQTCLSFADIGDNTEARDSYAIYRVPEPAALTPGPHSLAAVAYPFVYPDGSHDAETLLIHPQTGEMTIVTKLKSAGLSGVYTFPTPLTPGVVATLVKTGEVAPPTGSVRITSGAVHPAGTAILLRTYTSLFHYPVAPSQTLGQALAAAPCEVPVMLELQGEAVTFTANGAAYVTASEMSGQSLHFATCP